MNQWSETARVLLAASAAWAGDNLAVETPLGVVNPQAAACGLECGAG